MPCTTRLLATLLTIAALAIPQNAGAQDARFYAGGAGMATIQGSHTQGSAPSLPNTGVGGAAIGAMIEAGGFVTPRLALGVELSVPRRFTSVQQTDHIRVFQQESRHRDLALSGVLRTTVGSFGRARLAAVGGGGLVQESTRQRRRDQVSPLPMFPPVFGPYSDEYPFTRWTVAALAGADVEIAITPHIALVPSFRAHIIRRSGETTQPSWALGLNSTVLRPALAVRAAF